MLDKRLFHNGLFLNLFELLSGFSIIYFFLKLDIFFQTFFKSGVFENRMIAWIIESHCCYGNTHTHKLT